MKDSPIARMGDDRTFLNKCVSCLFDESERGIKVLSAFRLGKRKEDPIENPPPLKVVLESEADCQRVLSRTYRLKGQPFYIARDLSPEDRAKLQEAVTELHRRKQLGEGNLQIVDFRVVSRPQKIRWRPVMLVPLKSMT